MSAAESTATKYCSEGTYQWWVVGVVGRVGVACRKWAALQVVGHNRLGRLFEGGWRRERLAKCSQVTNNLTPSSGHKTHAKCYLCAGCVAITTIKPTMEGATPHKHSKDIRRAATLLDSQVPAWEVLDNTTFGFNCALRGKLVKSFPCGRSRYYEPLPFIAIIHSCRPEVAQTDRNGIFNGLNWISRRVKLNLVRPWQQSELNSCGFLMLLPEQREDTFAVSADDR